MTPSRFKTTDLVLATFLQTEGCEATLFKQGEKANGYPIGGWDFPEDQRLKELLKEFKDKKGKTEPKEFHDRLNKVREEMFDYLGIGKRTKK